MNDEIRRMFEEWAGKSLWNEAHAFARLPYEPETYVYLSVQQIWEGYRAGLAAGRAQMKGEAVKVIETSATVYNNLAYADCARLIQSLPDERAT